MKCPFFVGAFKRENFHVVPVHLLFNNDKFLLTILKNGHLKKVKKINSKNCYVFSFCCFAMEPLLEDTPHPSLSMDI